MLSMISPIYQLIYTYFNYGILHTEIRKLHFHRTMAYNCIIYSAVHICSHAYMWIMYPYYNVGFRQLYHIYSVSSVTGIIIVFLIAFSSWAAMKQRLEWHISSIVLALSCFVFHGSQHILGAAFGDNMVLVTFVICGLIFLIFNFTTSYMELRIVPQQSFVQTLTEGNITYVFLVVEAPPTLPNLPPGCYFTIYNTSSRWSLFHGHPFSVLYSSLHENSRFLSFFIRVSPGTNSFTSHVRSRVQHAYHIILLFHFDSIFFDRLPVYKNQATL